MKKILFCTNTYKTGGGGVASYAHDFVDAFSKDNEILIVSGDDYVCQADEINKVVHIPSSDFCLHNAKRLMDIINEYKPSLIVNSYFPLLALLLPYIQDDIKILSISHFMNGKLAWAAGFNGNYSDTIVALSSYNKKFIDKKFNIGEPSKTKVVLNFMPSIHGVTTDVKKNRNVLKIVYPGGHAYAKSAEVVCLALKKLLKSDLVFDFYWLGNIQLPGANWPFSRTRFVSDCVDSNDCRIKAFGPVSREEAKKIIAEANVFLLPSRGEGCPITLLEAMRAGCIPIISDAKHGSLDIIEDGKTGFVVKQGSSDAIYNRICDIIKNHDKYTTIYDNTLTKFESELSYEHWFKNMQDIFELPQNHYKRFSFDKDKFFQDSKKFKRMLFKTWLDDRFHVQPYHILSFRWIRYIK